LQRVSPTEFDLTAEAPDFLHAFTFEFGDALFTATDNGFDLYPGEPRTVRVSFSTPHTLRAARQTLTHRSLVDAGA
jgi:beta-mannosidase